MSVSRFFTAYFILISVTAAALTVADKLSAKRNGRRVREDLLMTVGFIGGAAAEYITMLLIRHKTKHKRFMIGLPCTVVFHIALIVFVAIYA